MKKKTLLSAVATSAFITFFCWGFPALKGAEVNWLHAAVAFVVLTALIVSISWFSGNALNALFEKDKTDKDERPQ
ncbi:MAG: hypothetical protein IJ396_07385 [Oscillibacter sp.]|nr:hypothetical protein [Oscillibacter sp.]